MKNGEWVGAHGNAPAILHHMSSGFGWKGDRECAQRLKAIGGIAQP
jgi:hypothetical protein